MVKDYGYNYQRISRNHRSRLLDYIMTDWVVIGFDAELEKKNFFFKKKIWGYYDERQNDRYP